MTYERAYYHKLMLEIGLTDDFDADLDKMLEEEDPLSDLALMLATCGGRREEQLRILNEYLLDIAPEQLDRQAVFSMVADRFGSIYESDPDRLEQITRQMYSVALSSGWWEDDDPWNTMYFMNDYYGFISDGLITKDRFMECFLRLIYQKTGSSPWPDPRRQKKPCPLLAKIKGLLQKARD